MTFPELLQTLGIFGMGIVAMAWLARAVIGLMLNKDLEKFKSDLEMQVTAYRIRYERLHAERVEVIKEVYKKISNAYLSLRILINPWQGIKEPTIEEKNANATKLFNELFLYFQENRIFIEEELAQEIDTLLKKFSEAWNQFQLSQMEQNDDNRKEVIQDWKDAWKNIDEEVPKVKAQLENKFRGILGIDNQ
jgi:hypothetical protein